MKQDILKKIEEQFLAGQEYVFIHREEWYVVRDIITALKKDNERLLWAAKEQD